MKSQTNLRCLSTSLRAFWWPFLCFWLTCFSFGAGAHAQNVQYTNQVIDLGMRSNTRVNPTTRAVEFQIPLGHFRGRAGLDVPVVLSYSSKVWNVEFNGYNIGAPPPHQPEPFTIVIAQYAKHSVTGWTSTLGFPVLDFLPGDRIYDQFGSPNISGNCTSGCYAVDRMLVWMPDGSGHELRVSDQPRPTTQAAGTQYYAVDGTRMHYDKTNNILYLADGAQYRFADGKYIDRNGNTLTYSGGSVRDTVDRTINNPIPYGPGGGPLTPTDQTYSVPGFNNVNITYTLKWRYLNDVLTTPEPPRYVADSACPPGFNSFTPTLFASDGSSRTCIGNAGVLHNPVVLSQILLPNNKSYTFTYDIYGAINKMVLPTGGYEKFDYSYVPPISSPINFRFVYAQGNRGVTRHVVSPTGLAADEEVWVYTGSGNSVTMTAEDNSRTESYLLTDGVSGWGYSADSSRAGRPYDQRIFSSTGQMIRRKLTEWAMTPSNGTGTPGGTQSANRNARPVREVEILLDTGGGPALATARTFGYDTSYEYNVGVEQTSINEFDFVQLDLETAKTVAITSIPNGTLLRTTETDYLTSDANYRARNLLAMPTARRVKDAAGNVVAQNSWSYDEVAYPLLTNSGVLDWTDPATGVRGNVTTVSSWLNFNGTTISAFPSGTFLANHMQYDQCGSVRNIWDSKDVSQTNPRQIEYSPTFQYAYPTKLTSSDPDGAGPAAALVFNEEYDWWSGLKTATVDENSQRTTFAYNDSLNRVKQVIRAATDNTAKNQTTYEYNDTARTVTVTKDLYTFNDNVLKSVTLYDGLGRVKETQQYEGPSSYISIQQDYDEFGRVYRTSTPLRPQNEALAWTTRTFDTIGRVLTITTPDGSVVTKSYSGNTVTVTNQNATKIKTVSDALGRLTDFYEDPGGPLAYQTTYTYNVVNKLIKVTQGSQQRFFMYDSLQRLIRFRNPEQGTYANLNLTDSLTSNGVWSTGYQYDANGNVTQKTDARGVTSVYGYDALNRETSVDYSDTGSINPDITRVYDGAANGKGKFWYSYYGGSENVGATVEKTIVDSFDAAGRPLVINQLFKTDSVWSLPFQTTRTYRAGGSVASQVYPSLHSVTYNYDDAGRLADRNGNLAFTGTIGDGAPRTYSQGLSYISAGHLKQEQFGTTPTPVYNKRSYNSRQQLAEIRANTTGDDTSWNRGKIINSYSLQCSGAACEATDNNGNLRKQQVFIPQNEQATVSTSWYQQYDYDEVNRLKRVHEYTGNVPLDWQQEYLYDQWGNRRIDTNVSHTFGAGINNQNFEKDDATNRLYAPGELDPFPDGNRRIRYDAAGNQIKDTYTGYGNVTFDAENRVTTIQDQFGGSSSYSYNADGQRVRRKSNNQEMWQVYGFDGELLAEYQAKGATNNPTKEYGYRNGQLLVVAEAGNSLAPPTFADDFNDNSLDLNRWTTYGGAPTVSEQSQQLQITLPPSTAGYNGVFTNSTYNLTNKMVQVESVQSVSQAGWCENFLEVELDANNYFMIQVGAGNMLFRSRVNGINDQTSIAFDGVANRFWRIRHDQGANLIYFETSANGSVWLTRKTVTPGFSLTALRFDLLAGAYGTGNSSPGAAKYDNVKLLASTSSSSLTVQNAGFESPVLGSGNWQYAPSGASWSFAGGGGISSINSAFTGVPSAAPEGVQIAFIQGNGTVSQSIAGFQSNTNYVITLKAIQRTNCCNTGGQDIAIYVDDVLVGSFHPSATSYDEYSTPVFTASTGAHTVKFAGLNPLGGDHTAFIDNVRITGSPKPGFGIQWLLTDQLGTPRMAFDESGSLANVKRHDYLPFGEELTSQGLRNTSGLGYAAGDGVRQQFTSKERDIETGLDYFGARFYASKQGRFTSIDPELASGTILNPQSWNRYSYVMNNPLALVDNDGKWPTEIHNRIIDLAFSSMSGKDRDILKQTSRSMDDLKNQTQATSYLHAMRGPRQTVAEAAKQASDFIGSQRDKAREIQAAWEKAGNVGMSKEALEEFGKALHTVTDMTSPAHEGFQVWLGIPSNSREAILAVAHNRAESTISYERLGYAVGAAVQLFQHTFGDDRAHQMMDRAKLGTEDDDTIKQIHADLHSNPNAESEAIYSYRLGLTKGYNLNWRY